MRVFRSRLRNALFQFLRKIVQTDDGRGVAVETLQGMLARGPNPAPTTPFEPLPELPYAELDSASSTRKLGAGSVFVTARFRSGSTLLWNLFRNVPGCTAYYEPFNERRWFDPAQRGSHTDSTHRGVDDYWREYNGLDELQAHYREDWIRRDLFMNADAWAPAMKSYVETLIGRAAGRPVLQFNRVDFRLPWLKRTFPGAKLVHLYRHPRDQWCSTLLKLERFPNDAPASAFAAIDGFYLQTWVDDLKYQFPFLEGSLERHPYQAFYYVWRLSHWFGRQFGDYSLSYEELVASPDRELRRLLTFLEFEVPSLDPLLALFDNPSVGKWRRYADAAWFERHEAECEEVLASYFAAADRDEPTAQRLPVREFSRVAEFAAS